MKNLIATLLFITTLVKVSFGQQIIELQNPSFEDTPRKGADINNLIKGWEDCGVYHFPGESPPDIHPVSVPAWGVTMKAGEGETYLGLVTRATGARESVSQVLSSALQAGKCYSISVFLALSNEYKSRTNKSMELHNFSNPVELFVWGGNRICSHDQLLCATNAISHYDWRKYTFTFTPEKDYVTISLEAFFKEGFKEPYNGHVLVDGLSSILEIECQK